MAVSNAVPGFKASVDGLHFTNTWPSEPDIVIDAGPLGKVPIGDASNGLCGGMVYTVMDVFTAGLPPIPDTQPPAQGSALFNYIVSRLFASFDIPAGVLTYYEWMNTPDHDTGIWFVTRRGVAWKTIMEEWPKIKADIDGGMLSPLGLVTVYSSDPTMMGHNHQVLAYAYEVDDANRLTLHLYDPNTVADGRRRHTALTRPVEPDAHLTDHAQHQHRPRHPRVLPHQVRLQQPRHARAHHPTAIQRPVRVFLGTVPADAGTAGAGAGDDAEPRRHDLDGDRFEPVPARCPAPAGQLDVGIEPGRRAG